MADRVIPTEKKFTTFQRSIHQNVLHVIHVLKKPQKYATMTLSMLLVLSLVLSVLTFPVLVVSVSMTSDSVRSILVLVMLFLMHSAP